ncbi:MarR family winged helix-turn-helix transcriptional regulator [Saccharopolyspora shandongensis]|uniref:MarR family winged helix-turn-helix transcriptional regulator n=1 Tax=Saccharopolyspora shandongensis TaxID=418495 RepID=UPI00340F99B2
MAISREIAIPQAWRTSISREIAASNPSAAMRSPRPGAANGEWRVGVVAERRFDVGRHDRQDPHGAVFELLDAVESAEDRGGALTVTDAAAVLGVDQPRSSRLAAQALNAGLLRREADQHDGRRSLLALTGEGREVLAKIRDFRHRVIAEATPDWAGEDRAALARLLTRFVQDFDRRARG